MPHTYFTRNIIIAIVIMVLLTGSSCKKQSIPDPVSAASIGVFETRLDNLRTNSKIPGMVAGIVKNGQVFWTKSYGYENLAFQKPVTNATIFHLASLTKTFASTVIVQLAKENKIDLNVPVSNYGVTLSENGTVRVIHLLTHTSEGVPGSYYKYNGDRYSLLSNVIQSATGTIFHRHAKERTCLPNIHNAS